MPTFVGIPREFIESVLARNIAPLNPSSVGASSTSYTARSASSPLPAVNVGHGNSLTLDYFDLMQPLLVTNQASHPAQVWWCLNVGVGGTSTPAMASSFLTAVHRYYNPALVNLLTFQEIGNHIGNLGASFATVRDATISYCATARGLGWKVAFHVPTPRAQKSDPGYSGSFSAWDPGRKAVFDQTCDYFRVHTEHYDFPPLDLAAVAELADPFNTTYYDADGCHFTATGQAAKAAAVAAYTAALTF